MASFRKSVRGFKRTMKNFFSPQFPSADQFDAQNPERFNLDPNRFLLPEPSFLTNLQEIDQPLLEAEQQALGGLASDEAEARRRLINQVGATGRFGSEISAFDFAPLEQDIMARRSSVRGTFSQRRAEARQRARDQLLDLRQGNLKAQREVEEANISRQFDLATNKQKIGLELMLAKIRAKMEKRKTLANLIGSGITAASLGSFGGGGAATARSAGAGAGAAGSGFTDIVFA